ncbi:S9 family peptidase [Thioalkalivibrio sp. XN279]|uniref:alpha/beta hydrolase family protein n=1 Tax=Thioalkalivibrio sp. XN279 TaxID=2714953 RepID=UPI00140A0ECE|nr:S9 family peptidase [Thioalkalivibrio sp. XN279]NHA13645.1 S9 family peptidase [Thioalkalivibrio sp. XN279]
MYKIPALILALLGLLAAPFAAAETIPAEQMFGKALVRSVAISPDGKHLAFTFEEDTEVKLGVMERESKKILTSFGFGKNMHVTSFGWASDSRLVMSVNEVTGSLDRVFARRPPSLYAANIDGTQREQIFEAGFSGYQVLDNLPDDPRHILIARYHFGDDGEPKGNLLDIYDGDLTFLDDQPLDPDMAGLVADNDGNLRGAVAVKVGDTLDDVDIRLYVKKEGKWETVDLPSQRPRPMVNFMGFSADNTQIYFSSNHDMPQNDTMGVFRYDFATGDIELMFRDDESDARGLLYTPGRKVLGAYSEFGPANYALFDDQVEALPNEAGLLVGLLNAFPEDDVFITSTTRDGRLSTLAVTGDRRPPEFFLFDSEARKVEFLSSSHPDIDKDKLVPMEPVRITARDGLVLHALLTRPKDAKKKLPLIVNVHGGPFGIYDSWGFNNEAQYFAQHGYATLQVNFRGSGNRGTDFQQAGWREWGGKMQDDVTDATRWAIEQGIADPDRICIYGGSYGGYATLMGVVKEPDLYACGVGYVGVYDLTWFREGDGSDFSRNFGRESRENFERFMNSAVGPTPESLRPYSPVHHVEKIKAELFIVHGEDDVRVPVGHSYRLREALDKIGKDYEWMIKEGEGHGFYQVPNRVDLYESMLAFFNKHIGPGGPSTGDAAASGQ